LLGFKKDETQGGIHETFLKNDFISNHLAPNCFSWDIKAILSHVYDGPWFDFVFALYPWTGCDVFNAGLPKWFANHGFVICTWTFRASIHCFFLSGAYWPFQ